MEHGSLTANPLFSGSLRHTHQVSTIETSGHFMARSTAVNRDWQDAYGQGIELGRGEASAGSGCAGCWRCDPHRASGSSSDQCGERCRSDVTAYSAGEPSPVIQLPVGTQVWIAAGMTDLRRGFDGLSAQVQNVLHEQPFSGHVFVFRGRRGDIVKLLWWDSDGLCLFAERLERGGFIWPKAESGVVHLSRTS